MFKGRAMRVAAGLVGAVVPFLAGAAAAQDAPDLESRAYAACQHGFAIIFPGEPMARDVTYTTQAGETVPARQFYLEQGQDRYSVTVVNLRNGPALDEKIIDFSADILRKRGDIRMQFPVGYAEGVRGHQIVIAQPNGRQVRGSVYMHDHRIYISEASTAVGDVAALQFDQSITITDNTGLDVDRNAVRRFKCR